MFDADAHASESNPTRRQFVGGLAAAASTSLLSPAIAAGDSAGFIDAHSHIWTDDFDRFPLADPATTPEMIPRTFTPEELFTQCRPLGVTRVVLIQHTRFHRFDNRYIVDAMRRHPGVFSAVACVDTESDRPDDEMRRLAQEGVRGFRILPWDRPVDRWLDGPGMQRLWKCGAEEGLAVCLLINPDSFPAVDRMCRRHPRTPVVIDHFGRVGIDGTIRPADLEALARLAQYDNVHVKVSAFYALGAKKPPYLDLVPMIRRMLDAYGPQRLMWASDSPYQILDPHGYRASFELVADRIQLSPSERDWLLRKTAAQIYFDNDARR